MRRLGAAILTGLGKVMLAVVMLDIDFARWRAELLARWVRRMLALGSRWEGPPP